MLFKPNFAMPDSAAEQRCLMPFTDNLKHSMNLMEVLYFCLGYEYFNIKKAWQNVRNSFLKNSHVYKSFTLGVAFAPDVKRLLREKFP